MPTQRQILVKHDKFLTGVVAGFTDRLGPLVNRAQKKTVQELLKKLTFVDDVIEMTAANQRVLRSIDRVFKRQLKAAGFNTAVTAYSEQFADHLPVFQDVINSLTGPDVADVAFTGADLGLFASSALNTQAQLLDVVATTAAAAKRSALFNVGGLAVADLTETIATQFGKTMTVASSLAETSISVFYRMVANQAYQKIETNLAPGAVRYSYAGPDDELTRPFCEDLLDADDDYTREEIEDMDNGQIAGVFTSAGGYNCRHQWILSLADEKAA